MVSLIFLIAGFLPLIFGAGLLVDSASSLAKRFKIPNIVIGLTIVAFGTSSPELIVNVFASVENNTGIVLGNVIGSNIFNILAILGITAFIFPLSVKTNTTWSEIPLCFLSSLVILFIANDSFIDKESISVLSRIDSLLLLSFFIIFLAYNINLSITGIAQEEIPIKDYSLRKSILFLFFGLLLLIVGGRIIVIFAVKLAVQIGIAERVIGLTIVSIGTSLPELATSVMAAKKKNVDIAIGNIVGSNIFNIFFILGVSAFINPVTVDPGFTNVDLLVNILASLLLFIFIFTGKGRKIEKWEGIILFVIYIIYMVFLITGLKVF